MSDIYVNGQMSISSFKVYRQRSSGGWVLANTLMYNQRYRFRFRCINRAASYPPVHFDLVYIWIKRNYRTRYYESSDYTGGYRTSFQSDTYDTTVLRSGQGKTIYAYFIWRGADGTQVNTFAPIVGMTARELHYLPNGPAVPLFPNVQ